MIRIIEVPAHAVHTEIIPLDASVSERIITINAGEGATVRIVCQGKKLMGSLKLTIAADRGATIFVGVACTVTDQFTITSTQQHTQPQATTRLWVRKIVADRGYASYQGTIYIAPDAQHSVVSQDDKTLLDGNHARAESIPALEVLAHEVVCNHGSAIGRVDPSALWYLQSRGLTQQAAIELWHTAFLAEAEYAVFK